MTCMAVLVVGVSVAFSVCWRKCVSLQQILVTSWFLPKFDFAL